MSARVRVLSSAADLPSADWGALAGPDDFFLSARWLRVAQATAGTPMYYLLSEASSAAGPDGACGLTGGLATVLAQASSPWLMGRTDTLLEYCAQNGLPGAAERLDGLPASPAAALLPSLVCGGRHIGRNRPLAHGGQDGSEDPGQIDRLIAAAEDLARSQGARSVAFLFVDERDTVLRKVLTSRRYLSYTSGEYSWLPVPADGFGGYLSQFSTHRRQRMRADRRRVAAAGIAIGIEPLSAALVRPLAELESRLFTKHGGTWSPEQSEQVLSTILAEIGSDALVTTARLDGALRGFALFLQDGDRWHGHRGGFDYDALGNLPVYFEVAFYHAVEAAAQAGVMQVHYGLGSGEAKRAHGCLSAGQDAYQLILS